MRRDRWRSGGPAGVLVLVLALAGAAPALAAPPANDAPAGAVDVTTVSAENGPVTEREGIAELAEATADAGVPRCLGRLSFSRTAWFRVPASPTPARVSLDAFASSGGPDVTPDLAAFVAAGPTPQTRVAQACDGAASKVVADAGAGVQLDVPAGTEVLVQVGARENSPLTQVVLAAGVDALPAVASPAGDDAGAAGRYPLGRRRLVPLEGATLTAEDPAVPACPASGSVWRQVRVARTGLQVAAVRGTGAGALSVFVGRRPSATNAVACAIGGPGVTEVPFRARRGQRAWVRVGTTGPAAPTAPLAVSGPCDQTPLRPVRRTSVRAESVAGGRRARALRLRLTLRGPCLRRAAVSVGQRGRVVARARVGALVRGGRVVRLRRVEGTRLRAGRARLTIRGRRAGGAVTRRVDVRLR